MKLIDILERMYTRQVIRLCTDAGALEGKQCTLIKTLSADLMEANVAIVEIEDIDTIKIIIDDGH